MKNLIAVFLLMFFFSFNNVEQDNFEDVSFLIIHASKNYKNAQKAAKKASKKLKLEYDEKLDCRTDKNKGFYCEWECGCGETHDGYIPRGKSFTEDSLVSVEHTNVYDEFVNGYFIVIVSSGKKKEVKKKLKKIKKHYPSAYIKTAKVYVGCLH